MQLDESATATVGVDGRAVVALSPSTGRQRWTVTNVALSGTGAADPEARVYLGPERPGGLLAASVTGNADSTDISVQLYPGQTITVAWSGGTPGASVTVSLYGTFEVAR